MSEPSKKLAKQRAARKEKDEAQARAAAAAKLEAVKPVEPEPILTPPENNAPKARVADEEPEVETAPASSAPETGVSEQGSGDANRNADVVENADVLRLPLPSDIALRLNA